MSEDQYSLFDITRPVNFHPETAFFDLHHPAKSRHNAPTSFDSFAFLKKNYPMVTVTFYHVMLFLGSRVDPPSLEIFCLKNMFSVVYKIHDKYILFRLY